MSLGFHCLVAFLLVLAPELARALSVGTELPMRRVEYEVDADGEIRANVVINDAYDYYYHYASYQGLGEEEAASGPCTESCPCWSKSADGHSCGERITWLKDNGANGDQAAAAKQVYDEFPAICLCGDPPPTPHPTAPETTIEPAVDSNNTFTIVLIPDTQYLTFPGNVTWSNVKAFNAEPADLQKMFAWVAANKESLNIQGIFHVGDVVEQGCREENWANFNAAWGMIKASGIPFSVAPGNHDVDFNNGRPECYNQHAKDDVYGGISFDKVETAIEGEYLNVLTRFEALGSKIMMVGIQWGLDWKNPKKDEVYDWVKRKVEQYSDHKVILHTHAHNNGRDGGSSGLKAIAEQHDNVFMLAQGHYAAPEWHAQRPDNNGHYVELMCDYQGGNNAVLKTFTFDKAKQTVHANSYGTKAGRYVTSSTKVTAHQGAKNYDWTFSLDF